MYPLLRTLALLSTLVVPIWPRFALADPPPPSFTLAFDGDAAIWKPFDDFEACESELGVTLCVSLSDLVCDGAGICEGNALFDFSGLVEGTLAGAATARVKCVPTPEHDPQDRVCVAKLRILHAVGNVDDCSAEIPRFSVRGPVDYTGLLRAHGAGDVCVQCPGGSRECSDAQGTLEAQTNPPSPWGLTVTLEQFANNPIKLRGTASADVDGQIFEFSTSNKLDLRSTYDADRDVSRIRLFGEEGTPGEGAFARLNRLSCQGDACTGGRAYFRLLGNKIRVAIEP